MSVPSYDAEEKQLEGVTHQSDKSDHGVFSHKEVQETAHEAAERGRAATDKWIFCVALFQASTTYTLFRYGQPLVHFDPVAEARLRWKIDLYIVPTVSLLYLFCFIDRANIGQSLPSRYHLRV